MIEAFYQQRWIPVINTESYTIPPHGMMEVSDGSIYNSDTGEVILGVKRPSADGISNFIINSHEEIKPSSYGMGTIDFPCVVLMDTNLGENGHIWGAKQDSYAATQGTGGLMVMGTVLNPNYRLVRQPPIGVVKCYVGTTAITAASAGVPGTGSVDIYDFDETTGVLSDVVQSGVTILNVFPVASGTSRFILGSYDAGGRLIYVSDYCG